MNKERERRFVEKWEHVLERERKLMGMKEIERKKE